MEVQHFGPLASWLIVAGAMLPQHAAAARQPAQDPAPRFRTGVDVVEVAVLARDSAGKPVTDLTREEITFLEDGVRQPHLERIPGRRKSLLLFSEGVDYDTADVLGQSCREGRVRRHADRPGRRFDASVQMERELSGA